MVLIHSEYGSVISYCLHISSALFKQVGNTLLMQEENELHERLAELQRKERFLMTRGRDQTRQPELGVYTYTYVHIYMYSLLHMNALVQYHSC